MPYYRQLEFAAPTGWRGRIGVALAMALGIGLAAAFILLSIGIAILFLPVVAAALGIAWWRWRKLNAALREEVARPEGRRQTARIIETEYRVIDDGTRPGA